MGDTQSSNELLQQIHRDCQKGSPCSCLLNQHLQKAFEHYDTDQSGTIRGFETTALVEDLTRYLQKHNFKNAQLKDEKLRSYILDTLDLDKNGTITKAEFFEQLKFCLKLKIDP